MSNKFEIVLSASDAFSKQFAKLDDAASKSASRALVGNRTLGKELANTFRVGSRHATEFASSLGNASSALTSLMSVGSAGSLVGAAVALGILEVGWARTGFEVKRTATAIGVSTDTLQKWQSMARQAGLKTEDATAALAGLAKTMQDAAFGRDPVARMAMDKVGIGLRRTADGLWDVNGAMYDLARVMSKIQDPQTRQKLAEVLHIPENYIPLLMKTADELAVLGRKAQDLGAIQGPKALEWADQMTNSFNRLGESARGAYNAVGRVIAEPSIKGMDFLSRKADRPFGDMGNFGSDLWEAWSSGPRLLGSIFGGDREPNRRKVSGRVGTIGASIDDISLDAIAAIERKGLTAAQRRGPPEDRDISRILNDEYSRTQNPSDRAAIMQEAKIQHVEIKVITPPGAQVTAKSSGPPVKIARSMDEN